MASHKPPPPAHGGPQFTATVTLQAPTGTPTVGIFYVFNGTNEGTMPSMGPPPNHNVAILGVNIGLTVLALIFVVLRVFSRWKFTKVWWDDFCISFSVLFGLVIMAFNIYGVTQGMGMHVGDLYDNELIMITKYNWLSQVIYCICLGLTKLSALIFLYRLHANSGQAMLKLLIATMIFVAAFTTTSTFATMFQCVPVQSLWDLSVAGSCVNRTALMFAMSALNVATDCFIVFLPLPMIIKVQLPLRQKLTIAFIFALSLLVCVASAVRMTVLYDLTWKADTTWVMAKFSIWTALEFDLAIICTSIPAMKPLIRHFAPRILGSSTASFVINRLPNRFSSRIKSSINNSRNFDYMIDRQGQHGPSQLHLNKDGSFAMTRITTQLPPKRPNRDSFMPSLGRSKSSFKGKKRAGVNVQESGFYYSESDSNEMIVGLSQGIMRTVEIDVQSFKTDNTFDRGIPRKDMA